MKITTHIRNLIFLCRENKKQDVNLNLSIKHLLSGTKHQHKIKNSWVRNQVALLIKKSAKKNLIKSKTILKQKSFMKTNLNL